MPHVLEIQDLDGRLEAAATSLKGFTTLLHDDTAMLNMVRTALTRTPDPNLALTQTQTKP